MAYAPARPLLAAGTRDRTVIFNLETKREVASLPHGTESVAFAPGGWGLLTANRDRFARLFEPKGAADEMVEAAVFRDTSPLWCATLAPDHRTIITTGEDGAIKLWDRDRMVDRFHLRHTSGAQWEGTVEFSPEGRGLLYNNDSLRLVDLETGSVLRSLTGSGEVFRAMAVSSDAKWLATGNRQGRVDLWDTVEWRRQAVGEGDGEPIDSLAFVPGNEPALFVATQMRSFIAGLRPGASIDIPTESLGNASSATFSSDGRMAALLMRPGLSYDLEIWDRSSHQRVPIGREPYTCVTFSPDGRQFAAGSYDGVVRLWQTDTWGAPALLVGHGGRVQTVAISPDGLTVASAADDTTIKLWNAATGRELLTFEARLHSADNLRFSPDGRALAVSGAERINFSGPKVIVWPAGAR